MSNTWKVFDRLPQGTSSGGGGSSEIPQKILDDLYNHINAKSPPHIDLDMANKIYDSITTKDIVFPISNVLDIGPLDETEFTFPYSGNITRLDSSISLKSDPQSNLLFSLQIHDGKNWMTKEIIQMQVGQKNIIVDTDIEVNNTILRINLLEGDFQNVESLNVIARVENIIY